MKVIEFGIGYSAYGIVCNDDDVAAAISVISKAFKLESGATYSSDPDKILKPEDSGTPMRIAVYDAGAKRYDGILRRDETAMLRQQLEEAKRESEQRSKWWQDEQSKTKELKAEVEGLKKAAEILKPQCPAVPQVS